MRSNKRFLGIVLGCLGLLILTPGIYADSIEIENVVLTPAVQVQYDAAVTAASIVKTGDYFQIIDFGNVPGGVGAIVAPAGWTASIVGQGTAPVFQATVGNPAINDVVFTYTGADISGHQVLGSFFVPTDGTYLIEGKFQSQYHNKSPAGLGGNTELTSVPAVPLPLAAWAGMSLLGFMGVTHLRRRQA